MELKEIKIDENGNFTPPELEEGVTVGKVLTHRIFNKYVQLPTRELLQCSSLGGAFYKFFVYRSMIDKKLYYIKDDVVYKLNGLLMKLITFGKFPKVKAGEVFGASSLIPGGLNKTDNVKVVGIVV